MFNSTHTYMKKSVSWISAIIQVVYVLPLLIGIWQMSNISLGPDNTSTPIIYNNIISAIVRLIVFYLYYLLLFPNFFYRQKFTSFIIFTCLIIVIGAGLIHAYVYLHVKNISWFSYNRYYPYWIIVSNSVYILITGMAACVARGFLSWLVERERSRQLEKRNLETSFALLKAQTNPHFLFNTLNNIDVLIEKDPDRASIYLKKLSDILRFTLYETPSEQIALADELKYIDQYIELQRIRTANPDFVKFELEGDPTGINIAPMLFIPFIENAFKHCTNKKLSNAIQITIALQRQNIIFNCSNIYAEQSIHPQQNSGLGLQLIQTRLDLLYPGNYQLDVDQTADRFNINLSINLTQ